MAVPLFPQSSELSAFHLDESTDQVRKILGDPVLVADINQEFRSWQYRVGGIDHDDFSHALIFRRATGKLVSFSRTFDIPVNVDDLFPAARTTYYQFPKTGKPEMTVRMCKLSADRLLLAFGSQKPGDPTTQLILIHRSILPIFYPWLAEEIAAARTTP